MRIYQPVEGPDRLPQAMVEGSTEYDWAELPDWLKDSMRTAADALRNWADMQVAPLVGEVVPETFAERMATKSLEAKRAKREHGGEA